MNVFVPGSYNAWNADDPSVKAEAEGSARYVYHRVLPRGIHRFKFVLDGDWKNNWGSSGQIGMVAPARGSLSKNGDDIVVNAPDGGSYTFTLDLEQSSWMFEAAPRRAGVDQTYNGSALTTRPQGIAERRRPETLLKAALAPAGLASETFLSGIIDLLQASARDGVLPLRNADQVVFAYLANAWETVQVATSWRGWGEGVLTLERQPDSPVFAAVAEAPPGVFSYKVIYNGKWERDRSNPWVTPDRVPVPKFHLGDFNSVVGVGESPLASGQNLFWYPDFESVHMGNRRDVFVWLPPSYLTPGERRYRTLYVLDGNESLTRNFVHDTARTLIEQGRAEDVILVFVAFASNDERLAELSEPGPRDRYARFFVEELVPYIDSRFRTDPTPAASGMSGVSLGGNFAYWLAWTWPDVFGCAAGQGVAWEWNQWDILKLYQSDACRPLRLYLDSATATHPGGDEDAGDSSRHAAALLADQGYSVKHLEMTDQPHDWESWRVRQPELIRWFAPVASRSTRRRLSHKV